MLLNISIHFTNYSTPVSDGYCFAHSISTALLKDERRNVTRNEISVIVMNELVEQLDFYSKFHHGLQNK